MSGGTPSNTTTTSIQQLPPWLNNANEYGASQAQNLYNQGGATYYPGNTVAPFSPMQEQYFSGVENLANQGSPVENSAIGAETNILNGNNLNPSTNPYLQDTFNQAANAVQQRLGSEYASQGRNPSMSLGAQADQMNQLATQIYGGNYANAQDQITKTLAYSPALDQMGLTGLNALNSAGQQIQGQAQTMNGANQDLYNYYANLPYTNLANYMNTVNSLSHGGDTSATGPGPARPSKTATALGGAASGAMIGTEVYPGVGTAVGAGLGLLAGYFA